MQKIVYLSNTRDYTEQGNINENKYFIHVNKLLEQGWKVANVAHNVIENEEIKKQQTEETFVAFVLLEKSEEIK